MGVRTTQFYAAWVLFYRRLLSLMFKWGRQRRVCYSSYSFRIQTTPKSSETPFSCKPVCLYHPTPDNGIRPSAMLELKIQIPKGASKLSIHCTIRKDGRHRGEDRVDPDGGRRPVPACPECRPTCSQGGRGGGGGGFKVDQLGGEQSQVQLYRASLPQWRWSAVHTSGVSLSCLLSNCFWVIAPSLFQT